MSACAPCSKRTRTTQQHNRLVAQCIAVREGLVDSLRTRTVFQKGLDDIRVPEPAGTLEECSAAELRRVPNVWVQSSPQANVREAAMPSIDRKIQQFLH